MRRSCIVTVAVAVALALGAPRSARAADHLALPALNGHVVDMAHALSEYEARTLDGRLEDYRLRAGNAIVALITPALGDQPIEDVAYAAFQQWKIGDAHKDNGVLIVVDPAGHNVRIETGKGVGGALTDLQTDAIIHAQMAPLLATGKLYAALDTASTAIEMALDADHPPQPPPDSAVSTNLILLIVGGIIVLIIALCIFVPAVRPVFAFLFYFLRAALWILSVFSGRGGGGGSGYSRRGRELGRWRVER